MEPVLGKEAAADHPRVHRHVSIAGRAAQRVVHCPGPQGHHGARIGCGSAGNRLTGAIPEAITGTSPVVSPIAATRARSPGRPCRTVWPKAAMWSPGVAGSW